MTFWLLLGLGLLAVPPARVRGARVDGAAREAERGPPRPFRGAPPVPARTLQVAAAVAVAGTALLLGGPTVGGLVAVVAAPAAWAATARLQARPVRARPDPGLPFALDLAAALLRAGQPVPAALQLVAPVLADATGAALVRAARLLALGADPEDAWAAVTRLPGLPGLSVLGGVAALARRSATSGIRLAAALDQAAAELRAAALARGQARAQRAGALAVAPLGLCFLPAFVCLGIVPVIAGMAHSLLSPS